MNPPERIRKHRAFLGAYRKGYEAAKRGEPQNANPYSELDTAPGGNVTWNVAFHRYWDMGWEDYHKEKKKE